MVSIVILAHNKAAYTDVCLRSILTTAPPRLELIVMNNGSTDPTAELLDDLSHQATTLGIPFKILESTECLGASTARNRCVAEASGGFLGLGTKVSPEEQAIIEQVTQALGDRDVLAES